MVDDALYRLSETLGAALAERGWLVGTAESCTGGLVAGALTAVPGSSAWFDRGFATYSNQAKIDLLGVPSSTLATHGAVSEPVARAMAAGVLAAAPAITLAVATTGIAGPGGATPEKPVGMVCFGFARREPTGCQAVAVTRQFAGERAQVRRDSVGLALAGLLALARSPMGDWPDFSTLTILPAPLPPVPPPLCTLSREHKKGAT